MCQNHYYFIGNSCTIYKLKYFLTICSTSIGPLSSRTSIWFSDCVFGQIGRNNYAVSNYLDTDGNGNERPINDRAEIIRTVNELHHNCGRWRLFSHNCEHVATSIRYGFQNCEQVINIKSIRICLLFVMSVTVMLCLLWLVWMWYFKLHFCTGLM